jgi:hypothetical protein
MNVLSDLFINQRAVVAFKQLKEIEIGVEATTVRYIGHEGISIELIRLGS